MKWKVSVSELGVDEDRFWGQSKILLQLFQVILEILNIYSLILKS